MRAKASLRLPCPPRREFFDRLPPCQKSPPQRARNERPKMNTSTLCDHCAASAISAPSAVGLRYWIVPASHLRDVIREAAAYATPPTWVVIFRQSVLIDLRPLLRRGQCHYSFRIRDLCTLVRMARRRKSRKQSVLIPLYRWPIPNAPSQRRRQAHPEPQPANVGMVNKQIDTPRLSEFSDTSPPRAHLGWGYSRRATYRPENRDQSTSYV